MKPDGVGNGTPLVYSKLSPGGMRRFFADHAGAAHFLHATLRIGDVPVAGLQLHRLARRDCEISMV